MNRWSISRLLLTLGLCALVWAALASLCLAVGSTGSFGLPRVSPGTGLFDRGSAMGFRLSQVLTASLVGAALAAAGVAYQAILRNPLADPYLLGVSSGASLAAYLWQLPWIGTTLGLAHAASALGEQGAAFAGAAIAVAVVFTLSSRRGRLEPVTLLLVGVIVNSVNGSIFLLINALPKVRDPAGAGGPIAFLVGGIQSELTPLQVRVAGITIAIGFAILLAISGQLNVAVLAESEAQSLGVRIHRLRWTALVVASIVTAAAVAISGPIGFVGLVCPHLGRRFVGSDQLKLLPLSVALGAGLLAVADAATRWLARADVAGTQLPVGVLTGFLGGPFFLALLWRQRRASES